MKGRCLWKISVRISSQAEEAVMHLLEEVIGQPACVYVDARTQGTIASVYAANSSDCSMAKRGALRAGLQRIKEGGLLSGPVRIAVSKIQRENWAESWKRHFKPIEIGSALLLKPSWSKRRPKKNQAMVILDPGLSFGTGQHPTTRFCLEQIVIAQKEGQTRSLLDIGTGSGILAIAARKLGYQPVTAIDSDTEAIRIARTNAKQNGVLEQVGLVRQDLAQLPLRSGRKYDVVCANLIFDLLLAEKWRILGQRKPGGVLVLAGILRSQFPQVQAAYEECGVRLAAFKTEKEWASGTFRQCIL